ncbi:MAG: glycine--tRNA ligase subunit beta [Chloroflexota bacterium]|nr:glycine--tRNA ligase subunit beta [Chloroflexota bacterium]
MEKGLDFQSIIMKLQEFWAERNCLIWQPYYSQVGAGTMNPATFLRVLGPEPWKVAYVEPSIRPDDGRYGDNPNRLQQFYQFQVILKPDPGNPQDIYLESLQALGIDPKQHDIRFVEDNWQQPAIGAWGLGWEVWLDGQEITQFTYFQQCGGINLDPISVELTYGLERIAMALQGVRHFKDIRWSPERTYGDVNLMGEREHSTYYFDLADVDSMRKLYDIYEHEAERAIEAGLVLPAHDYVLKTSHTFNILDTRGAVGVTERQALFARTRDLAKRVAEAYVGQRQAAEFPWLTETSQSETVVKDVLAGELQEPQAPFLLEIGTEEIPPSDLTSALNQLQSAVSVVLDEIRLSHGEVKVMGTPRRLVVYIEDLAARQPDLSQEVKGPPADRAFDDDGQPTRAAEGFARSKGINVNDLEVKDIDGGAYMVARVEQQGLSASEVLNQALPNLIAGIRFNKSMRWNESGVTFSRPIRWLMALHGGSVIPFAFAGYESDRTTRGLRFQNGEAFTVDSPQDYLQKMIDQGIILDPQKRKSVIRKQAEVLAGKVDGRISQDEDLLEEVAGMVERPTAFRGSFDEEYLGILPPEVLTSVMKKHQRYFVVKNESGQLLPYFVGVRNGGEANLDIVADGNEQVILARFDDAQFFIEKDLERPLESFVADLDTLTFQVDLGSFLDKTHRIESLVNHLGPNLDLKPDEMAAAKRAALLCKADLATNMVVEMTSLQGVMGRYYALKSGETNDVADAIFEHYLPRSGEDKLPESKPGLVVGLADRLDSLMGLFAVGLAPTGTKDPFAQRRAAIGICQNLIEWRLNFDLDWGLNQAAKVLEMDVSREDVHSCSEFIQGRLRRMLLDWGFKYDVVEGIMAAKGADPFGSYQGVQALTAWVDREDWHEILPAFSRCVRITRDQDTTYEIVEKDFKVGSERNLYQALLKAEKNLGDRVTVDAFLNAFRPMVPEINKFFDEVLVMDEDRTLRENRLGLLQRISALSEGIVDLGHLEGF